MKAVTDWGKGDVILKVGEHTVKVDINKLMKYPSRASEDLGAIDFADDQDIEECVQVLGSEARKALQIFVQNNDCSGRC